MTDPNVVEVNEDYSRWVGPISGVAPMTWLDTMYVEEGQGEIYHPAHMRANRRGDYDTGKGEPAYRYVINDALCPVDNLGSEKDVLGGYGGTLATVITTRVGPAIVLVGEDVPNVALGLRTADNVLFLAADHVLRELGCDVLLDLDYARYVVKAKGRFIGPKWGGDE